MDNKTRPGEPVLLRAARMLKAGGRLSRDDDQEAWHVVALLGRDSTPLAVAYVNACEEVTRLKEERDKLIEACLFSVMELDGSPIAFTWRIGQRESFSPTHSKFVQAVRAVLGLRHERESE